MSFSLSDTLSDMTKTAAALEKEPAAAAAAHPHTTRAVMVSVAGCGQMRRVSVPQPLAPPVRWRDRGNPVTEDQCIGIWIFALRARRCVYRRACECVSRAEHAAHIRATRGTRRSGELKPW